MFTADDAPALHRSRVLIAGVTGAGKTTLAKRLAEIWNLRHVEIDALFHGPGWTPRPEFTGDVRAFAAEQRWVTESQYTSRGTEAILAPRAELVLWLDYPYRVVRARLVRRTVARQLLRTELWNGNRERGITNMFRRDATDNILLWQTRTLHKWAERMPDVEVRHPHLTVVRFGHPRETQRWLARVAAAGS
ncbi:AAA family ATPase [Microbacterium sp. OR16]|uniref:AAA family ATPase n=1 Tax=Microbacterium sp. OR16 TaxID=3095345 RepID=UPI0039B4B2C8